MQHLSQDAVSAAVLDLQRKFVYEMCRAPTTEECLSWYNSHRNTKWACDSCIQNGTGCLFQPPDFLLCTACAAQRKLCSAKLDELHTRVKQKLNVDDLTFDSLCQHTVRLRQLKMMRMISEQESASAKLSGFVNGSSSAHNSVPLSSTSSVYQPSLPTPAPSQAAVSPAPMTSPPGPTLPVATQVAVALHRAPSQPAPTQVEVASPHTPSRSPSIIVISTQPKPSQENARNTPAGGSFGTVHEEIYNESQDEIRRLRAKLEAAEAKNRELEESLKAATDGSELVTLMQTVKNLEESFADLKSKNNLLSQRVKDLVSQDTVFIQKELLEHANIHVLIRLLALARDDFAARKLSRAQMLQTLENLSEQLHEVADRRLEKVPVGFGSIQEIMLPSRRSSEDAEITEMKTEEDISVGPPSKRPRLTAEVEQDSNHIELDS